MMGSMGLMGMPMSGMGVPHPGIPPTVPGGLGQGFGMGLGMGLGMGMNPAMRGGGGMGYYG